MKLIDKDALVAEIENRIKELQNLHKENEEKLDSIQKAAILLCIDECKVILSFLDTLEVKEVDLEKIINDYFKDWKFDEELDIMVKPNNYSVTFDDIKEVAKHFFELGLKIRIDKELVEEVYSHIDSIKDTADRMTSGNFMHNRAVIKFSANTIAKVLELMGLKAQKGEGV